MKPPALTYRDAGVDLDAADRFVAFVRKHAKLTYGNAVVDSGDAYAGLVRPPLSGLADPLLAATCDGVGTKLLVARDCQDYSGIGQDLVAMNVNDLLPRGARPLFFSITSRQVDWTAYHLPTSRVESSRRVSSQAVRCLVAKPQNSLMRIAKETVIWPDLQSESSMRRTFPKPT